MSIIPTPSDITCKPWIASVMQLDLNLASNFIVNKPSINFNFEFTFFKYSFNKKLYYQIKFGLLFWKLHKMNLYISVTSFYNRHKPERQTPTMSLSGFFSIYLDLHSTYSHHIKLIPSDVR